MAQLVWRAGKQGRVGVACVDFHDDQQSERYLFLVVGTTCKIQGYPAGKLVEPLDW